MRQQKEYVPDEGTRQNPEEKLSDMEIGNLHEKEFRVMIVKMIQELRKTNGGMDQENTRNV